jgi:hypothetical protein
MPREIQKHSADDLPTSLVSDLAPVAKAVRELHGKAVMAIIEIGGLLDRANKKMSSHKTGVFDRWVFQECGLSKTSAWRALRAYREWGGVNRSTVVRLETTALYLLSAPSCPVKAKAEAVHLLESGKPINSSVARQIVARHKPARKPKLPMNALELIDQIRKAMWVIYENAPEELRSIVAPKFQDFGAELERTGDLNW